MRSARLERFVALPAPARYALSFVTGLALDRRLGLPSDWLRSIRPLGWVLLGLGVLIGPGSALLFALRGTTLNPAGRPLRLITSGAYRFTRNPMYLGLAAAYVGLALVLRAVWPILLLPLPLLFLNSVVIPYEEQRLTETFGDDFSAYRRRVRRWL
jgi:protein-S-isoprenylcysteine O-methyltransferase Ste14